MITLTMNLMKHSKRFMTMSRRIIMAVALSLVLVAPRSFAAQETGKVGVVDSGKIFQQLPEAKQAETSLQAAAGPLQKEIAMKNQELQRAIAEYQKQAPKLTPAARNAKEKELNVKSQSVQKFQQEQSAVFEKKRQDIIGPVQQKLTAAIKSIAQKEGFTLILDKNAAAYFAPEYDITFKVMNELNIK